MFAENRSGTTTSMGLADEPSVYVTDCFGQNTLELAYQSCIRVFLNDMKSCHRFGILQLLLETVHNDFMVDKSMTTQLLLLASDVVKHAIVSSGNVELAKIILENGYPVNFREPERDFTALDCAIIFAKNANVKFLFKHGASINTEAKYKLPPLYYYTRNCQDEDEDAYVLKSLLEHYIKLKSPDKCDFADLEWLFKSGNRKTVRTALRSGIDFNSVRFSRGKSFLHLLLDNEDEHIIYILDELDNKLDINTRDADRKTALLESSHRGLVTAVECLLKHGADANVMGSSVYPVLLEVSSEIIEGDEMKITQLLLQHGADAQFAFKQGSTLLSNLATNFSNRRGWNNFSDSLDPYTRTILGHLAMLGTLSKSLLTDRTHRDIESALPMKSYFDLCTRQLEEIKNVGAFYGTVRLFDLLTTSEEKIVALARNQEFILAFNSVTKMFSHYDTCYLETLRKRIGKAIDKVEQERTVALVIESLTGICCDAYHSIIYKIISYLNFLDLQDLCKFESIFLVKK